MAPKYLGPFEVQRIVDPVAVRLKLPLTMKIHPAIHGYRIKPVNKSALVPVPPTLIIALDYQQGKGVQSEMPTPGTTAREGLAVLGRLGSLLTRRKALGSGEAHFG